MATGDLICPCCGSYQRCGCRRPQTTWVGIEDKRIADALERIVELLEEDREAEAYLYKVLCGEGE